MSSDNKRRLIYNRRVAPNTFVFFFHRGPGESSWSIRDYSVPGSVALRYASDFQDAAGRIPSASEIRASAQHDFPAPAHPTTDLDYWHAIIQAQNAEFLADESLAAPPATHPVAEPPPPDGSPVVLFPMLNLPKLMALPKARK